MTVLLTGGTGYIGSHTALVLHKAGYQVLLLDNLGNSNRAVLDRLKTISGHRFEFVQGDVRDFELLKQVFQMQHIEAVIHLAGLKSVSQSHEQPQAYHDNNVQGSLSLLQAMKQHRVGKLVFSSSATVYGNPLYVPIDEDHPTAPASPYGQSKMEVENILKTLANTDPLWQIACLRYFNPVGAHSSGLLGEDAVGMPHNLMPVMAQVAAGQLPALKIYGNDYPTPDGSGVRDYLHIDDLAQGHLAALQYLEQDQQNQKGQPQSGYNCFNLGTGQGTSVFEMVKAFEQINQVKVHVEVAARRDGDVASYYAKADKAQQQLKWKATRSLEDMCRSVWAWQKNKQER
jgi:UDP-glucose 4-epimerase